MILPEFGPVLDQELDQEFGPALDQELDPVFDRKLDPGLNRTQSAFPKRMRASQIGSNAGPIPGPNAGSNAQPKPKPERTLVPRPDSGRIPLSTVTNHMTRSNARHGTKRKYSRDTETESDIEHKPTGKPQAKRQTLLQVVVPAWVQRPKLNTG
jgi:hypothetical protein